VCVYTGKNPDWGSYLDNLHVRKAHQSKGIGKSLFIEGARFCFQKEPLKGMCLLVNQDNHKAQGFYKKLGGRNAKKGVWNAPDGSTVPTYWFVWDNLSNLIKSG
jgi:ribosomal protein S18 acetylase RimI-like enzyme